MICKCGHKYESHLCPCHGKKGVCYFELCDCNGFENVVKLSEEPLFKISKKDVFVLVVLIVGMLTVMFGIAFITVWANGLVDVR